jgi:DNA-binding transcriptional MerR regulator
MMTIGRLARTTGMEAKTLRYYDRVGLLRPAKRSEAGYRLYDENASGRLRFILRAKALGIALADIRRILAYRDEGLAPCRHVLDLVGGNIMRLENQIRDLESLRKDLRRLHRELNRRIPTGARAAADCPCFDVIADFEKGR